ncbi:hypothetical protein POTOM_003733 [Populus tomentosa]|uniref:Uncharacterized protein n=1 Tax=Populus tomentosa TaxID=118781 RepID=A0A8X8AUI0_POPTO|nr:hypothetical protein POTOM_003733 [Populus tomentosa]
MPRTVVELEYIGNNLIATVILHYTFLFVKWTGLSILIWYHNIVYPFLCPTECKEKLKSSLLIMGEIGVNDYNLAFHYKLT